MPYPDFLIIGTQKAGTTSLFEDLRRHPGMRLPLKKEIHFFDLGFHRSKEWYSAQFPPVPSSASSCRVLTGEASPYYLFHPRAAERCFGLIPDVRLIVLLRNPVDRAYSHYNHCIGRRREWLSFEEALRAEEPRLRDELPKLCADESYTSHPHRLYSYVARGIYADQLDTWMRLFPAEQMLLICSEEFFRDPANQYARVHRFLGVPTVPFDGLAELNRGSYPAMAPDTRDFLVKLFAPHNARLYDFVNRTRKWAEGLPDFSCFWDR